MGFIEEIESRLSSELPGEEVHLEVSPMGRIKSSEAMKSVKFYKESAVAIVLHQKDDDWYSILTQRQAYKGYHSGQVCFPGGKKSESDNDLLEAALRECEEEIGLPPEELQPLGELTPVYIPVSNHYVTPFVFYLKNEIELTLDAYEVKEAFSFNLIDLINPNNFTKGEIQISPSKQLSDIPYFLLNRKIVWGATALMLNELRYILQAIDLDINK